jgi:hypothetical protein
MLIMLCPDVSEGTVTQLKARLVTHGCDLQAVFLSLPAGICSSAYEVMQCIVYIILESGFFSLNCF